MIVYHREDGLQQAPWPTRWLAFPTWLITLAVRRIYLPTAHPWSRAAMPRFYSLETWWRGQTPLCRNTDIVMWAVLMALVGIAVGM